MGLLEFIGVASSIATLHSWLSDNLDKYKGVKDAKALENLSASFREERLLLLKDEYTRDKLDEYIAAHVKGETDIDALFSDEQRQQLVQEFLRIYPQLRYERAHVETILNQYLDLLSELVAQQMTFGEKLLLKETRRQGDQNAQRFEDMKTLLDRKGKMKEAAYSEDIINTLNLIDKLIKKNVQIGLWLDKGVTNSDYLKAEDLLHVFMSMKDLFSRFNNNGLHALSGCQNSNPIELLVESAIALAPDMGMQLGEFYWKTAVPAITCIYSYEAKDDDYFVSLGALGLFQRRTEADVFECVMSVMVDLLNRVYAQFSAVWKPRNHEKIQQQVKGDLIEHLHKRIMPYINKDTYRAFQILLESGAMLDTELAEHCGYSVKELRCNLYTATDAFLFYQYHSNTATKVNISPDYRDVIKAYEEELFGGFI